MSLTGLPKFVTLAFRYDLQSWETMDSDNMDDAMVDTAIVILDCEQGRGLLKDRMGVWRKTSYAVAHEMMRKVQQRFKPKFLAELDISQLSLDQIMGLGEATPFNTPNTPVDPKLTGESPYGEDDPTGRKPRPAA